MGLDDVLAFQGVEELRVSPDGRRVAFLVRSADVAANRVASALWIAATDASGPARRLAEPASAAGPLRFSPDGSWLACLSRSGTDPPRLVALPLGGGPPLALGDAALAVSGYEWSPDGDRLLLIAPPPETEEQRQRTRGGDDARVQDRDWRRARLWVGPRQGAARPLTGGSEHVREARWSPDGRRIAFVATPTPEADSTLEARLYVVEVASGGIGAVPDSAPASAPAWSPDGRRIGFIRPFDGREISRADVFVWTLAAPRAADASAALDRDAEAFWWTEDGTAIDVLHARGAWSAVSRMGLAHGRTVGAWEPRGAVPLAERLPGGWVHVAASGPEEVEVAGQDGAVPLRLTALNTTAAAALALPTREVIRYRAPAGEVEAVLTRPPGSTRAPLPLVLRPHGGPRSHVGDAFDPQIAALASEGFLVLQANFRGSTGYGDAFARANVGDWGEGPFADVMAGADHLVTRGEADPRRLFLYGWSYGGILANWAATHGDRLRAIVSGAGVADFRLQYALSDARRWRFDYFGGSPFLGHLATYERLSPISHVGRARVPTLFLHGENDVRCPPAQGLMMYRALRDVGVEAELVIYPREGHLFEEPRHIVDRLRRVVEWFRRHDPGPPRQ
jgi:dipeptidyl aminopeptidase/acylaminoacyl peptidase